MFKELVEARTLAKKEYDKISKEVKPYWDKYMETEDAVLNEFVKQKLYIPIDKLPKYLDGHEISQIIIVFDSGETEQLYHNYDICYETTKWEKGRCVPARRLVSNIDDDGYSFDYDIDEDRIVGFYDLELADNTEVKETYMEEILKNVVKGEIEEHGRQNL